MLATVPVCNFKDFKPDVVICPQCTQHLMGVMDVRWAANQVAFTYGCAGCGHELDQVIAQDADPISDGPPPAVEHAATAQGPTAAPAMKQRVDNLGGNDPRLFPFHSVRESAPKADLRSAADRLQPTHLLRQPSIEDRMHRSPRETFSNDPEALLRPDPSAPLTTRASALLRDVAIFNL